ncbi:MAG: epoxide hydrolase [Cellvibrionaceae bacterium]|nr:epoxide hydrolase [Cellvibrionaceae bacterium]|tara:strand:- start:36151 stop:37308 length:1158 start_codon:yes stop_codon:yes gene_type:complete
MTIDVRKFEISVSNDTLQDLKQRLALTRWPEKETVNDWSQGVPLEKLKQLCSYWEDQYDWSRCERNLNRWPHFKTEIDGLDIHFLHIRSPHKNATPMIMTHGWPGSIIEFADVIEPLTEPEKHGGTADDAFHLIIPSLPGFGFSQKPTSTGWNVERIAKAWTTLVKRLGYREFVAQGGDWGFVVTSAIGKLAPPECLGIHVNMLMVEPDTSTMDQLTPQEKAALDDMAFYQDHDSGYAKQQSTRPQTIGYSLVDSPVGLAAWIYEKFYAWTDNNGQPEDAIELDRILDNIMMYWINKTGASAGRLYWESLADIAGKTVNLPTGVSIFPKEIFRPSQRWAERYYRDIFYWSETEKGGHFAAFEQPELFVNEVRQCFSALKAHHQKR